MRVQTIIAAAAAAAAVLGAAGAASASVYTFVGSWQVDQGPGWPGGPPAYTGQEAAALIFGGSASDYAISTIDSLVADINFSNWVSTWGGACGGSFPCGTVVAQNYKVSTGGNYVTPGDTSAYVSDWSRGEQYRNYAFTSGAVPEPAAWALMIGGFGLAGAALRRRRQVAVAA